MLPTNSSPTSLAGSLLAQFLRLCEQLHTCSDAEIQSQLHQLAFTHPEQLVQPVRLLLHGSQYIQQQVASAPSLLSPTLANAPATLLSAREQEVLALLAQGYTLPRIGDKLATSYLSVQPRSIITAPGCERSWGYGDGMPL